MPPRGSRRPSGQNQQVTRAQGEERQHVPLPVYLRRRKRELSEERRKAAEPPEPEPPPGYRRVGAEEQQQAIETLSRRREIVVKSQDKLPMRIETIGQRQRERELKDRLIHLDKLIAMFSKPVVFVPADSEPICDFPAQAPAPVEPSPRPCAEVDSTMLPGNSLAQQRLPPNCPVDMCQGLAKPDVMRAAVPSKIGSGLPTAAAAGPFCRLPMQPPGGHANINLS